MDLAANLRAEYARRRAANRRYSLRAFARAVGTSHASLSRLWRGTQRPRSSTIAAVGARLGWTDERIAGAVRDANVARLCALVARPGFRADVRWLAVRLNLSLDEVQLALHEALRCRRLSMSAPAAWRVDP
jgi:hypothetical protein